MTIKILGIYGAGFAALLFLFMLTDLLLLGRVEWGENLIVALVSCALSLLTFATLARGKR